MRDHGWLKAKHTFSFANYRNPKRMNFGVLRVLNDDTIQGGKGFPLHPHDNMEIITIPLAGSIYHKDNMGNESKISSGDIQVMSAGTGVYHSEFNANNTKDLKLLQIWLFTNRRDVNPRYQQITLRNISVKNEARFPEDSPALVVALPILLPSDFAKPAASGIIKIANNASFQF